MLRAPGRMMCGPTRIAWEVGAPPAAPVYEVTDDEAHREEVDTRDLKPLP